MNARNTPCYWRRCALSWLMVAGIACVTEVELPALEAEALPCEDPLEQCEESCVNIELDENNCGGCGEVCAVDESCVQAECQPYCSDECEPEEACIDGVCTCRTGLDDCEGECVNLDANFDHCGGCFDTCGADELCLDGECVDDCVVDDECFDACVDLLVDPLNCGVCGNSCQADELCIGGLCTFFHEPSGCDACPCDCELEFTCCFDDFLDTEVCVQGDSCGE